MIDPHIPVLDVAHVRRVFGKEKFVAVEDVSLQVQASQVHALLGPNGAGKTTTVRMCATLLAPTSGQVRIAGIDAVRHPEKARSCLGLVLGGDLGFYPRATARDNLLYFADLQGVSSGQRRGVVADVLERVKLTDSAGAKVGQFSRGMRQRLHLARALLGAPPLLLLDEPTTGLDPDVALTVRDIIRDVAAGGTAVLLTSHSMPEVEELADIITVIGAGKIAVCGSVRDIADYAGVGATTTFTLGARKADIFAGLETEFPDAVIIRRPRAGNWAVTIYWDARSGAQAERLVALLGHEPEDLVTRPASLEETYLALADGLAR